MLLALCLSIISMATIVFSSHRLLCYLRHFQELGYGKERFVTWMQENSIYDRKGSSVAAIAAIIIELTHLNMETDLIVSTIAGIGLVWLALTEDDPLQDGFPLLRASKKSTAIYNLALSLYSILMIIAALSCYALDLHDDVVIYWLIVIISIQFLPIWLLLSARIYKCI